MKLYERSRYVLSCLVELVQRVLQPGAAIRTYLASLKEEVNPACWPVHAAVAVGEGPLAANVALEPIEEGVELLELSDPIHD